MIFRYYPKIHFYTHFRNRNSRKKNSSTSKKKNSFWKSDGCVWIRQPRQIRGPICSANSYQHFARFYTIPEKNIFLFLYQRNIDQVESDSEMYFLNLNLLWLPYPEAFTSVLPPRKTFEEIRMTKSYTIVIERLVWIITKSFHSNA